MMLSPQPFVKPCHSLALHPGMDSTDYVHLTCYYFDFWHQRRHEELTLFLLLSPTGVMTRLIGFRRLTRKTKKVAFSDIHGEWTHEEDRLYLHQFSCTGKYGVDGVLMREIVFVAKPGENYQYYGDTEGRLVRYKGKVEIRTHKALGNGQLALVDGGRKALQDGQLALMDGSSVDFEVVSSGSFELVSWLGGLEDFEVVSELERDSPTAGDAGVWTSVHNKMEMVRDR